MPSGLSLVLQGIVVKCTAAIFFLTVDWFRFTEYHISRKKIEITSRNVTLTIATNAYDGL